MPDPKRYKDQKHFMRDCMRITKQEGLNKAQQLGKCINMWREEHEGKKAPKKASIHEYLRYFSINNLLIRN